MHTKTEHLLPGCKRPSDTDLDQFYDQARRFLSDIELPNVYQARWIGADADSTQNILAHIRSGNKTGTVSVPQAAKYWGHVLSAVGDTMILINYDGTPAVLVRLTQVETVSYDDITERHTAVDGPSVRALDIWRPLHRPYFDRLLEPCRVICEGSTDITFETFEVIYDGESDQ